MRLVAILIVLSEVLGSFGARCYAEAPARAANGPAVLDGVRVLAIAREAVATNDTWVKDAEFGRPRQNPDGSWSIIVWRLPKQPGGHRLITINAKGEVIQYLRGA